MASDDYALTIYFDGSCPLCRTEIAHYRKQEGASQFCFSDVSKIDQLLELDLTKENATARFHVRRRDGELVSGAAAFANIWRELPRWRWAARFAEIPGVLALLERGYQLFLPVRPTLADIIVGFRWPVRRRSVRAAIEVADDAGDAGTAVILTAFSRALDKALWFLEAHEASKS